MLHYKRLHLLSNNDSGTNSANIIYATRFHPDNEQASPLPSKVAALEGNFFHSSPPTSFTFTLIYGSSLQGM